MVYEGLSHERSDVIARRIALTGDLPAVLSFGVPVAAGPFEDLVLRLPEPTTQPPCGFSLTDSCPISRLEIVDTGRRRRWSDGAKVRIVEESLSGPRLTCSQGGIFA
jgi:hypothetical protein